MVFLSSFFFFPNLWPGANVSLLVSVTGSDNATVTEVSLAESMGSGEIKGVVEPQEGSSFLVKVAKIPSVQFVVRVKGQDNDGSGSPIVFQRQSSTSFRSSNLTISVRSPSKASLSRGPNELKKTAHCIKHFSFKSVSLLLG